MFAVATIAISTTILRRFDDYLPGNLVARACDPSGATPVDSQHERLLRFTESLNFGATDEPPTEQPVTLPC